MLSTFLIGRMPGGYEWILILIVVLVLFGGRKIPELMRGLGRGVKEFKEGVSDINSTEDTKE
jgi:sec-independent protein translocase protein TatA